MVGTEVMEDMVTEVMEDMVTEVMVMDMVMETMGIIMDMGMVIGTIGTTDIGTTAMGMDMVAGGMVAGTATV